MAGDVLRRNIFAIFEQCAARANSRITIAELQKYTRVSTKNLTYS